MKITLPRHLDKTEHYDQMRKALETLATGVFPGRVEDFARTALEIETRNAAGLTFTEFLAGIEAAEMPVDDEGMWLPYWSQGYEPAEAIREEGCAGGYEPDEPAA